MTDDIPKQLDITAPDIVEVEYDANRKALYVHVDGYTALRICRIKEFQGIIIKDGADRKFIFP